MEKKLFLGIILCFFMALPCFAQDYLVVLKDSAKDEVIDEITTGAAISLFSENDSKAEIISEKLNIILADEEKAKELLAQGKAEFIEPDCKVELFSYNDEYYIDQTYYNVDAIEKLKSVSNRGKGVRVGVIDSGVYREHPDFEGADIEEGYNFVDENTDTNDYDNHGTGTLGIMAAQDNNGIGIAGIAPDATYIPLMANSRGNGYVSHIVKAIIAAVDEYDCKILNISMGTKSDFNETMKKAVEYATENGVIIVAAAGNTGSDTLYYPAAFDNVIGVGSVDSSLNLSYFSERNTSVDAVAMGSAVAVPKNDGEIALRNGTSFSAPIVTGLFVLLLSIDENISPQEANELIKKCTIDLGNTGYDVSYGYGIVRGDELYRAYLDRHTAFITAKHNGIQHTYKYYSDSRDSIYVYYAVFNNGEYKYGEYTILRLKDNCTSDVFEYELEDDDEIKAIAFENFDTLKSYGFYDS